MYRADRAVGVALIAVGTVVWIMSAGLPRGGSSVEPATLPRIVGTGLAILGVVLASRAHSAIARGAARSVEINPGFLRRLAIALAALSGFAFLIQHVPGLGLPLLAPPLMIILGRLFGGRRWITLTAVSIVIAEGAYISFHYGLGLVLPRSAWF